MYYVYIMASDVNGTLYIGMTNDLIRRVDEHRRGRVEGFTTKYGVRQLVQFEEHKRPIDAIKREKQIKKWNRIWKTDVINQSNPEWDDLFETLSA